MVIGNSRMRLPVAWKTALPMAAASPTMPISPTPLTPSGFTLVVVLVDKDHVDVVDVGIHRHVVLGQVVVHEAAEAVVGQGLLLQRHADAP